MKRFLITDYGVIRNSDALQTEAMQAVLNLCRAGNDTDADGTDEGSLVIIPKGRFYVGALRMWSNTTLYLEAGAELFGSDNCEDYEVFPESEGMEMRSDMELISQYYNDRPWETYRRAIITAYGEKNISIIGETDSLIDGVHCYDPNGEENYRGPHAIFLSCCENVTLEGYTVRNSGNFLHEANNCRHLTMRHVTCLAGSDGIHLHCTEHALIENCLFKTGDDCIAGINIKDLTVKGCILNTSCSLFRIGGTNIHVEDCYAYGPGYYPHRMTVVKGKGDELPREAGRHNTLYAVCYFASMNYPFAPSDIHFKNCVIENILAFCDYIADGSNLQSGTYWGELSLENVRITGLEHSAHPVGSNQEPMTIHMKNVSFSFAENATDRLLFAIGDHANVTVKETRL